jgi:hypothetical protein
MNATRATLLLASALVSFAATAGGCNLLLGTGYTVGALDGSTSEDGPEGKGDSPTGADGGGRADACSSNPQDKPQLESACTNASCQPFDNASRNPGCMEGGTVCPALFVPEAGAQDTGAPDASSSDAGTAEAGAPGDGGPTLPSCFHLPGGPKGGTLPAPILYATGSTAIQPYMARVAQVLENLGIASVVYLGAGSCFGVNAMLNPQQYPLRSIGATATYYDSELDPTGAVQSGTCAIDDDGSTLADLGISDVFPTTCVPALAAQGGLPNNLHDFFGPVQVMEMVVPATSSQTSISAQAAYMVWGFGSGSGVAPWTDDAFLLQRSASSGTQNMIAAAIGVPAAQWHGLHNAGSGNVLAAISNVASGKGIDGGPSSDPHAVDKTMGILASDVADGNRQVLKPLAFQDVGESCGWFPDSTAASFDKQNVRDGHYPIWGPSHLIASVESNGTVTNPAAVKTLIDAMNGQNAKVLGTLDVIQFYAKSHIIPTCAMHVQRAQDGHDYQPYAPATSCSCYYDLQATGQTSCVPCKQDADCAGAPGGATTCVNVFGVPPVGYCEPPGTGQ